MNEYSEIFAEYDDILTIDDLAKMLKIGKNKAYRLLNRGEIKSIRIGKIYRIPKENVIEYLRNSR